jgi:hypothetical protein
MWQSKILNVVFFDYSSQPILTGTKVYKQIGENIVSAAESIFAKAILTTNELYLNADYYILLCAHLSPLENLKKFPPDRTIYYNFEQMYDRLKSIKQVAGTSLEFIANNFFIADFSSHNLSAWANIKPKYEPLLIQYGYNKILPEYSEHKKNIDLLYYGGVDIMQEINALAKVRGLFPKIYTVRNIYGAELYDLIKRSRLVLSHIAGIFPSVRVSPLVSSGIPVLCCADSNLKADKPFDDLVKMASVAEFPDMASALLHSDTLLTDYGESCRNHLSKFPFRNSLARAFTVVDSRRIELHKI